MQNFIISISKYNDKKLHNYNMFSNLDKEQKTLQSIVFLNSWGDQSLKWIQLRFAKTYTCFLNISQYEWVYRPDLLWSINAKFIWPQRSAGKQWDCNYQNLLCACVPACHKTKPDPKPSQINKHVFLQKCDHKVINNFFTFGPLTTSLNVDVKMREDETCSI